MKIKTFVTGFLQINTYLVYDEDTLEGFIVDIGKYLKDITDFVKKEEIHIKYIIVKIGRAHVSTPVTYSSRMPSSA